MNPPTTLATINAAIVACTQCERLVAWRCAAASAPPKRHAGETYHARGVPGFGDPSARALIIGLAPAAHGANRTGRMFTGDRSGEWLYRALHKAGFANQPTGLNAADGLRLKGAYITAACRCAPPDNKPNPGEFAACSQYLDAELDLLLPQLRVIVVLGALAYHAALTALARHGIAPEGRTTKFAHGAICPLPPPAPPILMSYHPSQQNTFTGLLTGPMFDAIWTHARKLCGPHNAIES